MDGFSDRSDRVKNDIENDRFTSEAIEEWVRTNRELLNKQILNRNNLFRRAITQISANLSQTTSSRSNLSLPGIWPDNGLRIDSTAIQATANSD